MPDTTSLLNTLYEHNPNLFTEEEVDALENISKQYQVDFQRNYDAGDTNLLNTAQKFFNGIITGFTTFKVGEAPTNSIEAVAQSVGHLIGFIGIPIPGVGTLSNVFAKGLSSSFRLSELGLKAARQIGQFKSVPIAFGDLVIKGAKGILGKDATAIASKYLLSRGVTPQLSKTIFSVGEAGLHLGSASWLSSWQDGIDAQMSSLLHGAIFGGAFRTLGNVLPPSQLPTGKGYVDLFTSLKEPKGIARILASSLVSGLPSTIADDPTELQVYNYLLGAYFGGAEMATHQYEAMKFMSEAPQKGAPGMDYNIAKYGLLHPESLPGYKELSPKAKEEVDHQAIKEFGRLDIMKLVNGETITEGAINLAIAKENVLAAMRGAQPSEYTKIMTVSLQAQKIVEANAKAQEELKTLIERDKDLIESGKTTVEEITAENYPALEAKYLEEARISLAQVPQDLISMTKVIRASEMSSQDREDFLNKWNESDAIRLLTETENALAGDKNTLGRGLISSIRDIAIVAHSQGKEKAQFDIHDAESIINNIRTIAEITEKHINEPEATGFQDALSDIKTKLKLDISVPTVDKPNKIYTQYRGSWLLHKYLQPVNQVILDVTGKEYSTIPIAPKEIYLDGTDSTVYKSRPFMKELLDKEFGDVNYRILTRVRNKNNAREELRDTKLAITPDINDGLTRLAIFKEGSHIVHGVKDNGQLIIINSQVDGVKAFKIIEDFTKIYSPLKKEIAQSIKELREEVGKGPTDKELEAVVHSEFANNILIKQKLHQLSDIELAKALKEGTIFVDSAKENKRTSLLNNGFLRFEPSSFTHIKDAQKGLNIVTINEVNKNGLPRVEGKNDLIIHRLLNGEIVDKVDVTHIDGAFLIRNDIFEAMANGGGQDIIAGGLKGSLVHTSKGLGLVLGKYLYHKAGTNMSRAMLEHDLHGVLNTTGAKSTGKMNTVDAQYSKDNRFTFYKSGTTEKLDLKAVSTSEIPTQLPISNTTTPKGVSTTPNVEFQKRIYRKDVKANRNKIYLFGDNLQQRGLGGQAREMRGEPNAIGIPTKKKPSMSSDAFMTDVEYKSNIEAIDKAFAKIPKNKTIVIPEDGLGTGLAKLQEKAPKTFEYLQSKIKGLQEISTPKGTQSIPDVEFVASTPLDLSLRAKYTLPHDAFTITSAGEHPDRQLSNQTFKVQKISGLDNRFPSDRAFHYALLNEMVYGDKETNNLYQKYKNDSTFSAENIDLEKLSIQNKIDILFGNENTPIFKKLIASYMDKFKNDPLGDEGGEVYSDISEQYKKIITSEMSTAQRLLDLWDYDRALMFSVPLQKYVQKAVAGRMLSELRNPKAKHSWASKMRPYKEDLRLLFDLKPGETLIDNILEKKEIPWLDDKIVTIKEAWSQYEKATGPKKKQMESMLEIMVERVPTSDPSGIRILKIKGLTGDQGTGMVIHPEDMRAMDGADLDGDSLFAYAGVSEKIKDEYKAVANDQYRHVNEKGKPYKKGDKKKFKVFIDPKEDNPFIDKTVSREASKSVLDTGALMRSNRRAYQGNELLAPGINQFKAVAAVMDQHPILWDKYGDSFRRLKTSLINAAADASEGTPLVNIEKVKEHLNTWLADKFVKERMIGNFEEAQAFAEQEIKYYNELNSIINGRSYGKAMDLNEIIQVASNTVREDISIINPFFKSAQYIKELDLTNLRSAISDNIAFNLDRVNKLLNADPDLLALLGRRQVKFYNDFRTWKTYKKADDFNKFLIENEIKSQSLADYISVLMIKNYAPKEWRTDKNVRLLIKQVGERVDEFKKNYRKKMFTAKDVENSEQRVIAKNVIKSEMDAEAAKIRSSFSPEYKKLFDAFMLSSLHRQSTDLDTFVAQKLKDAKLLQEKKASKDKNLQISQQKENAQEKERYRELARQKQLEIDELEIEISASAKSEWWASNLDTFPFELRSISPEVIQWWGKQYSIAAEKINKYILPEHEIEEYVDSGVIKEGLQLNPPSDKEEIRSNFDKLTPEIAKLATPEMLANKEYSIARQKIERFLESHPTYINEVGAMLSGDVFSKSGELIAPTPELASKTDVLEFAQTLDAINQANPLKKRSRWFHLFMHPMTVGEKLGPFDPHKSTLMDVPLISSKGTGYGDIVTIESTHKKAWSIHNAAANVVEAQQQTIDEKFSTTPLFIALQQIPNGDAIWNIAVRQIEARRGNKSAAQIAKENNFTLIESNKPIIGNGKREVAAQFITSNKLKTQYPDKYAEGTNGAILINEAKLRQIYEEGLNAGVIKAQVPGVKDLKLPSKLFPVFEDFKRFVIYHERAHLYNKRLPEEELSTYENRINKIALEQYQLPENLHTRAFIDKWEEVKPEYLKLMNSKEKFFVPKLGKEVTYKEMFKDIKNYIYLWARNQEITNLRNDRLEKEIIDQIKDSYGYLDLIKARKILMREFRTGKAPMRGINLYQKLLHQSMLERIRLSTLDYFSKKDKNKVRYTFIAEVKKLSGTYKEGLKQRDAETNRLEDMELVEMANAVEKDMDYFTIGDIKSRQLRAKILDAKKENSNFNVNKWMNYKDIKINPSSFESYYPHMDFKPKIMKEYYKQQLIKQAGKRGDIEQLITANERLMKEALEENGNTNYLMAEMDDMLTNKPVTEESMGNITLSAGHDRFRSIENPTPGWSTNPDVLAKYEKKLIRTYHQGMAAFLVKGMTDTFIKTNALGPNTQSWARYLTLYNRDALGLPSYMPKEWLQKGEPFRSIYYPVTDQFYVDLIGKLNKKMNASLLGNAFKGLTKAELESMTPGQKNRIKKLFDLDFSRKVNMVSRWEAKWQLVSLLSHTKTIVNNLTGGSINTIGNAGFKHWKNAKNIKYLQDNIFLNLKSKDELLAFIEKMGGIESFYKNELMLNSVYNSPKMKKFGKYILASLRKNKGYNQDEIDAIGKQFGQAITEKAAWFMRKSEVALRTRSWMAHYLNAREIMGANKFNIEPDNPWLISYANKGVWATQFLYNNANRPAFARTAMGKIFTRFQLFAFNSLRFRKNLFKTASEVGFRPGSAEFKRLQRMMVADTFMLALASIFPSTLFENAMAPPFSYLQDLSDYFFGDEEKRNRAFWGALPYPANIIQPLSPPASRVAFNTITWLTTGDLDRMGIAMLKWMPFGRLGVDVVNTVKNPINVVRNATGFPLARVHRYIKGLREEKK